ncbi:MAG: dolichyl-phosphate beta-D-mannosyltransferase [Burkholderiales bacterium]|jgi:dolichol-phosphate mannosyltransferase|nr:dolichyl-phosphate beta-D-mannosyltransferase [Burkholderiales bacterium]
MIKKLIIIATYNERDNIEPLLAKIYEYVPEVNVLVVDDSSPDKTYEIVEQLSKTIYKDKLFLLKRSGKLGLGTAYVAGFNWGIKCEYDVIMEMDADFSHNPKYLPQFFEEIKTSDLVIGSRYIGGGGVVNWGIIRKIISQGGSMYSRFILGLPIRDLTGGFKCYRREVLEKINVNELMSNGYSFQIEGTYKTFLNRFKIKEIPIIFEDRRVGQSKMSGGIFLEALLMVLKLRLRRADFIKK